MEGNGSVISQIFLSCCYTCNSNKELATTDFAASLEKCCLPLKW